MQSFDEDGNLLCIDCHKPILQDQFYVVVRQRDMVDTDAELAVHAYCFVRNAFSYE